jgi:hypothetical protein
MSTELPPKESFFAVFDALSETPRAAWLNRHNLRLTDYQNRHTGGWDHHSLNTDRYLCANRAMTRFASGATEETAEVAYCDRYGLPWYKLDGFECAKSSGPRETLPTIAEEQLVASLTGMEVMDWE